jgi:carotenoid cleavage dioxygenase-like enzyme
VKDDSYEEVARKAILDQMLNSVQTAKVLTWLVCETLTFLNCKNVARHHYVPKKSENADLPAVLLPKFTYHVLDVFRERKEYVSMEEIRDHLWAPRTNRQSRATLVRGHFKNIRGTLWWWNAHMRNKKNATTVGVVVKDYNLVPN